MNLKIKAAFYTVLSIATVSIIGVIVGALVYTAVVCLSLIFSVSIRQALILSFPISLSFWFLCEVYKAHYTHLKRDRTKRVIRKIDKGK